MAIIFMDGFENNSSGQWDVFAATIVATTGLNMSGTYCMDSGTNASSKNLGTSYSELYISLRVRETANTNRWIGFKDSAGTVIATISCSTTTKNIRIIRGSINGTVLATGTKTISLNTTYLLEVYIKPLNSDGVITVKIDGVEDVTYTGDTTNGLENVQQFGCGRWDGVSDSSDMYWDDVIVSTSGWIGNKRIAGKSITGAGTTTQWDPSAGTNYSCIDEIPPAHSDYNSTNTADEIDTFALADCTESIGSIAAVQVTFNAAYEGSPTPTHIQAAVRSGGTNYFSDSFSPPSTFGSPHVAIWETNPADSAAWEEADINALEVGYKAVA